MALWAGLVEIKMLALAMVVTYATWGRNAGRIGLDGIMNIVFKKGGEGPCILHRRAGR
jgi:hypothetical protein